MANAPRQMKIWDLNDPAQPLFLSDPKRFMQLIYRGGQRGRLSLHGRHRLRQPVAADRQRPHKCSEGHSEHDRGRNNTPNEGAAFGALLHIGDPRMC